jgi:hypothetical protein
MPFKLADWRRLMARLGLARQQVEKFRATSRDVQEHERYLLDAAVISIRDVGEYAVNVHLELRNLPPERHHRTSERARELQVLGHLRGVYDQVLDQLESFRQVAQYAGYVRRRSTHYSASNIETCLSTVDQLVAETVVALRAAGKDVE